MSAGYCNENENYGIARGSRRPVVTNFYKEQNVLFNATAFPLCKEIIILIIIIIIIIILHYIIILNIISSVCLCLWTPGKWFLMETSFLFAQNNARDNL